MLRKGRVGKLRAIANVQKTYAFFLVSNEPSIAWQTFYYNEALNPKYGIINTYV